jgi:hypothetical protein
MPGVRATMLPSAVLKTSASAFVLFRGSIPRPTHSLFTLRGHGYPCADLRPRKTRSRLVALPSPVGPLTRWVPS